MATGFFERRRIMTLREELINEGYPENIASEAEVKYEKAKETELMDFCAREAELYRKIGAKYDLKERLAECKEVSQRTGVHRFFADFLLVRALFPVLSELYREKGLDESFILGVRADLRAKCIECFNVKGKVGTFVTEWYRGFFSLRLFPIGRLQYEMYEVPFYEEKNEDGINYSGRKAINMHIPSLGKLDIGDVKASIADAAKFFAGEFEGEDEMLFMCYSWLLFPAHREMLPPDSGICKFMDLFETVHVRESRSGSDLWRIFNTDDFSDLSKLDSSTALRRGYIKLLGEGKRSGGALGIIRIKK